MIKKPSIDLRTKNISFEDKNQSIKLLLFKKSNMTVEVSISENGKHLKNSIIAFAHLPKKIKSILKPL